MVLITIVMLLGWYDGLGSWAVGRGVGEELEKGSWR